MNAFSDAKGKKRFWQLPKEIKVKRGKISLFYCFTTFGCNNWTFMLGSSEKGKEIWQSSDVMTGKREKKLIHSRGLDKNIGKLIWKWLSVGGGDGVGVSVIGTEKKKRTKSHNWQQWHFPFCPSISGCVYPCKWSLIYSVRPRSRPPD